MAKPVKPGASDPGDVAERLEERAGDQRVAVGPTVRHRAHRDLGGDADSRTRSPGGPRSDRRTGRRPRRAARRPDRSGRPRRRRPRRRSAGPAVEHEAVSDVKARWHRTAVTHRASRELTFCPSESFVVSAVATDRKASALEGARRRAAPGRLPGAARPRARRRRRRGTDRVRDPCVSPRCRM